MKARVLADLRIMPLIYERIEDSKEVCESWIAEKIDEMVSYLRVFSPEITVWQRNTDVGINGQKIVLMCGNRHKAMVVISYEE